MSRKLRIASITSLAATMMTILLGADGSSAVAQNRDPEVLLPVSRAELVVEPAIQAVPVAPAVEQVPEIAPTRSAGTLAALVAAQPQDTTLSPELHCLAGAIYFEAKGESLPGQLAVGKVIIARSQSGRFPRSYCGVVYQPSQFSFVRGHSMPAIPRASRGWREAVAIAQIAHADAWESPVEGALFFHAARVSPGWRLKRLARVDNHVFYR